MAPVIIHPSKEPDGEGKVSVKILFLDWGVYSLSHSRALSISLCPCLSRSFSLVLSSSLSNPPPAVFYQILSQGASYKTNRAHQDRAPEDRFGQPLLIYCGPGWVKASAGIYQAYQILSADLKSALQILFIESDSWWKRWFKGTWAVVLNQQSYPETLDKHTAPGFVSGLVGLWGRKVCA